MAERLMKGSTGAMGTRGKAAAASADGTLAGVCEFIADCEHKTAPTQDTGFPSIRTPNIGRGRLLLEGVNRVSAETYAAWTRRAEPREGDLILAREAPVGNVAIVTPGLKVCLGQRTVLLRPDTAKISPAYLLYLLLGREIQTRIQSMTQGATVPHLNLGDIRSLVLPQVPKRRVQDRIADILSTYDDLIENNTKRIKILEEMTSVAFSLMEAGASAATERALGDIVDEAGGVVRTGPFGSALHESDYTAEGSPVVMPKNLIAGRIDTSDIARIPDDVVEKLAQHKLSVGDIVYGRRGDIGRRAFIGKRQVAWLCGTGCLRISLPLGGPLHPRYLHEYLGKPDVVAGIAGAAVGATMPNLNTSILRAVPVKVPDTTTQSRFSEVALVNDDLIEVLRSANGVLRAQRDLLLPRLISGEVALDTAETDRTALRADGKPSRVSDRVAADSSP